MKLPVIVTEPSNKSQGIENATVRVKTLTQYGYNGEKSVSVVSSEVNTTSTGFAMVEVNFSGVQNGDYFVKIEVEYGGENTTTSSMWDNPRVSIRNFVVRGDIGMKGDMSGITKWVIDENMTDELYETSMSDIGCWWNGSDNCADIDNKVLVMYNWPYYNKVFYNSSNGMVIVDSDTDFDFSNAQSYNVSTELVRIPKYNNNSEFMNVSVFGTNTGVNMTTIINTPNGTGNVTDKLHKFNVSYNNGTDATISITKIERGNWLFVDEANISVGDTVKSIWGWDTTFSVTNITSTAITLRWNTPTIVFNSGLTIEGKNKVARVWDANNGYSAIIYNSPARKTAEDLQTGNEWKETADTVMIVDNSTGAYVANYTLGEPIPELGNKTVLKSEKNDERIYLSDTTLDGKYIYPMPWTCDNNNNLYVAKFSEQSVGMKVKDNGFDEANLTIQPYYMLFFDGDCNGEQDITNALFDDDPVFDDRSSGESGNWMPYDGDHAEEGYPEWPGASNNMSERWMRIGEESWPFTITFFNTTDADLFSFRDWTTTGTNLTLWVSANDFEGQPINGNITVKDMTGMTYTECSPPEIVNVDISGVSSIVAGVGYFNIDLGNVSMGDYTIRFDITATDGKKEILEKHIWIEGDMKEEMVVEEGMSPCSSSGGGGTLTCNEYGECY